HSDAGNNHDQSPHRVIHRKAPFLCRGTAEYGEERAVSTTTNYVLTESSCRLRIPRTSVGTGDDVLIRRDRVLSERLEKSLNRIEQLDGMQVRHDDAGRIVEAAIELRTNERARLAQRQRR